MVIWRFANNKRLNPCNKKNKQRWAGFLCLVPQPTDKWRCRRPQGGVCAWRVALSHPTQEELRAIPPNPGGATGYPTQPRRSRLSHSTQVELHAIPPNTGGAAGYPTEPRWSCRLSHRTQVELQAIPPNPGGATGYPTEPRWSYRLCHRTQAR